MPNSRVRELTEKASTPATPTTAMTNATAAKTPETTEFKRSGVSTSARTSCRVAACSTGCSADRSRIIRGIGVGVNEHGAPQQRHLLEGMIDGEGGAGDDVLVIEIGEDANDAARGSAEARDELDDGIGPRKAAIDSILIGEHALRDTLADDDNLLGVAAIGLVKITPSNHREAERGEKSGRDGTELGALILFPGAADVTFGGELQAGTEVACVAPGNGGADGDLIHAGKPRDAANGFAIETDSLIGSPTKGHDGNVQGEDVVDIEASLSGLQRQEGFEEYAGADQQQERRSNLSDDEDSLASAGASGDAYAAT